MALSRETAKPFFPKIPLFGLSVLVLSLGTPQIQFPFAGRYVVATDVIFVAIGTLLLVSIYIHPTIFRWSSYYLFLIAYLLSLLVSCFFSTDILASLAKFPVAVYLAALSVLVFNIINTESNLRTWISAWLVGTGFAVCLGIATIALYYLSPQNELLEYLTYHFGAVPVGNYPRITATFVSASMFCNYLNVSLLITVAARLKGWIGERMGWLLATGIVVCATFTISIGLGGLFLAFSLMIFVFRFRGWRFGFTAITCGAVSIGFLLLSLFALSPYPGGNVITTVPVVGIPLMPSSRSLVWSDALRTFVEHPLTGVGLGRPTTNVLFTNTDGTHSVLLDAHNSVLNVAAEAGVIGLAAFLALIAYLLRPIMRSFSDAGSYTVTAAAGIAFICAFVYQGLTGSFEEARHLWVLIGLLMAAFRIEQLAVKIPERP
jgi:O-antigen ligase